MFETSAAIEELLLLTDDLPASKRLADTLASAGAIHARSVADRIVDSRPSRLIVDVDLASRRSVEDLKAWLKLPGLSSAPKWFLVNPDDYRDEKQALALGAVKMIYRPLKTEQVLEDLRDVMASEFMSFLDRLENTGLAMGVRAAHDVLTMTFQKIANDEPLSPAAFDAAAYSVADALAEEGLADWLSTVNQHHSSSYRHSLLVAGAATCFVQFVGANRLDQARVARAALAHDVGKSLISLTILDKPGKLDAAEEAEIRRHPQLGYDLLVRSGGFSPDTLDAVLHHHEMCDGSGYPKGLRGSEISDISRVVTIADIFAALIEVRSYKPALSHVQALEIMGAMGAKLDLDLMRVFSRMITDDAADSAKQALAS